MCTGAPVHNEQALREGVAPASGPAAKPRCWMAMMLDTFPALHSRPVSNAGLAAAL